MYSAVADGANYSFWTAQIRDFRAAHEDEMVMTSDGQRFPPEYGCVIYTLMTHLYDDEGVFRGWSEGDKNDLDQLLQEMRCFTSPILVGGSLQPPQLGLTENYQQATVFLETKARFAGILFKEGSTLIGELGPYAQHGHPYIHNDDGAGHLVWHWDRELLRMQYFASTCIYPEEVLASMSEYLHQLGEAERTERQLQSGMPSPDVPPQQMSPAPNDAAYFEEAGHLTEEEMRDIGGTSPALQTEDVVMEGEPERKADVSMETQPSQPVRLPTIPEDVTGGSSAAAVAGGISAAEPVDVPSPPDVDEADWGGSATPEDDTGPTIPPLQNPEIHHVPLQEIVIPVLATGTAGEEEEVTDAPAGREARPIDPPIMEGQAVLNAFTTGISPPPDALIVVDPHLPQVVERVKGRRRKDWQWEQPAYEAPYWREQWDTWGQWYQGQPWQWTQRWQGWWEQANEEGPAPPPKRQKPSWYDQITNRQREDLVKIGAVSIFDMFKKCSERRAQRMERLAKEWKDYELEKKGRDAAASLGIPPIPSAGMIPTTVPPTEEVGGTSAAAPAADEGGISAAAPAADDGGTHAAALAALDAALAPAAVEPQEAERAAEEEEHVGALYVYQEDGLPRGMTLDVNISPEGYHMYKKGPRNTQDAVSRVFQHVAPRDLALDQIDNVEPAELSQEYDRFRQKVNIVALRDYHIRGCTVGIISMAEMSSWRSIRHGALLLGQPSEALGRHLSYFFDMLRESMTHFPETQVAGSCCMMC